jgi:hypothetical protein
VTFSVASWLARGALITGQQKKGYVVDPELLAGRTPKWAVSLVRSLLALALAPFVLLFLCSVLPQLWILALAHLSDQLIWSHIKDTHIDTCSVDCRAVAFGMITLPVCWLMGIHGACVWYRCFTQAQAYQAEQMARQQGPLTDMTTSIDKLFARYRGNSLKGLVIVGGTLVLQAAILLRVGDTSAYSGTADYEFPFALLCILVNCGTAGWGFVFFATRRTSEW